jgi:hypothetical protein
VAILNFLLEDLVHKFNVDEDKVYLTGHSMGAFGTWDWALEHPEKFAAIVPVSGCSSSTDSISAWKLRNVPVWVFHGKLDKVVDIQCNTEMVSELEKFSKKVRFTIYPERGHDTWEPAYTNDEMFTWLAGQDRKNNRPVGAKPDQAMNVKCSGRYLINGDTITIGSAGDYLYLQTPSGDKIDLLSEGGMIFSFKDNPFVGIIFRKSNNNITGFMILENSKQFARRITPS